MLEEIMNKRWVDIAYGPNLFGVNTFVAIGYKTSHIAISENGINWIESKMPANVDWQAICYGAINS